MLCHVTLLAALPQKMLLEDDLACLGSECLSDSHPTCLHSLIRQSFLARIHWNETSQDENVTEPSVISTIQTLQSFLWDDVRVATSSDEHLTK